MDPMHDAARGAAAVRGRSPAPFLRAISSDRFDAAASLLAATDPAHPDDDVLFRLSDRQLAPLYTALVDLAVSSKAQAQQQQEQLESDRAQLAAERAAVNELLEAACLELANGTGFRAGGQLSTSVPQARSSSGVRARRNAWQQLLHCLQQLAAVYIEKVFVVLKEWC
uniref:Uncharacterized protein n=1 Tax=Tetradesmus obliquus TaxID=3088 RepID=A0A383VAC8_TETOB|eukprot:jgi/Sobl393_1/6526/SZX62537.1